MMVITPVAAALALGACLVALPACTAIPAGPGVGTIDECAGMRLDGPPIGAALCREVAETAFRGYPDVNPSPVGRVATGAGLPPRSAP